MRTTCKIPAGWRRLRTGNALKKGDRMWHNLHSVVRRIDLSAGDDPVEMNEVIIRRIKRRKEGQP